MGILLRALFWWRICTCLVILIWDLAWRRPKEAMLNPSLLVLWVFFFFLIRHFFFAIFNGVNIGNCMLFVFVWVYLLIGLRNSARRPEWIQNFCLGIYGFHFLSFCEFFLFVYYFVNWCSEFRGKIHWEYILAGINFPVGKW